jgi:hypothetical protein
MAGLFNNGGGNPSFRKSLPGLYSADIYFPVSFKLFDLVSAPLPRGLNLFFRQPMPVIAFGAADQCFQCSRKRDLGWK